MSTLFENIQEKRREEKIISDPKYENFNEDLGIDELIDKKFIEFEKPLKYIKDKYLSKIETPNGVEIEQSED